MNALANKRPVSRELCNIDTSAVAIITRPPEIIACLKLRLRSRTVFIIFDSHPRPSYPNGAGMMISPSIEGTARRLTELLPTVDLRDSFLQWQAQLLGNYSGHVFVPHGIEMSTPTLWQAVLESSLAQLSMQAELANLRSQNDLLKSEQERLESEIREAQVRNRQQERRIQQLESPTSNPRYYRPSTPPRQSSSSSSSTRFSYHPSSSKASTSPSPSTSTFTSSSAGTGIGRTLGRHGSPPTPPVDREDSLMYAMRLQHEYDNEDRALSVQRTQLSRSAQRLFECSICMEEMPVDSIARIDSCGHTFCRECLRGHVSARIDEHRFPVLCPTCTANKGKGKGKAGGTYCSVLGSG